MLRFWKPKCRSDSPRKLLSVNSFGIKGPFVIDEGKVHGVVLREAHRSVEAGSSTSVAGSGPLLGDVENDRVLIAIRADFVDLLSVPRGRSFVPDFLAGARVVDGFAFLDRHF